MINCPECGQAAPDDARFCDRCGQGLKNAPQPEQPASAARPDPLAPGATPGNGIEIVELIARSANENRYRVKRDRDGTVETLLMREREADNPRDSDAQAPQIAESAAAPTEDPAGPHAKTAELTPPPAAAAAAASGESMAAADQGATGALEEPLAEALAIEIAARSDGANDGANDGALKPSAPETAADDLGELFGRVLALSQSVKHPAFVRALDGFASNRRVYLLYPDEELTPLSRRPGGLRMDEAQALAVGIQVCQAVGFMHQRAMRLNDLCPDSIALATDGRVRLSGLDYVSNDTELETEPLFNDGYSAPEVYRGRNIDKRADVFSVGALLYSMLTGERLESESWREEAGAVQFYPPHVVSPEVEQAVRKALMFEPARRWPTIGALKNELVRLSGLMRIQAGAITDVGMVRDHNEDSVLAVEYLRDSLVEPAQSYLYTVADGMGGAEAGEVASAIAVQTVRDYVEERLLTEEGRDPAALLKAALEEANRKIVEYAAAHPESRGMGSTAVSALIVPPLAAVAWVGDSRAYLCEGAAMRQVTKDHSLVQRLVEIGQITAEEARHHEHKNVITRSLGARTSGPAGAEAVAIRLKRGDRLMLCSDGLIAHVDDPAIAQVIRRHDDPMAATRELVVAANAGGGTDNVSVICIFAA